MSPPFSSPPAPPTGIRFWLRWLPWLGGSVLAGLVVLGLLPKPLPVELAPVVRAPLVESVGDQGRTRVKHRYVISSPVAGQLKRIDWKAGAVVEAGKTVIAELESAPSDLLDASSRAQAEARVHGAEATGRMAGAHLASAQAAAAQARTDQERMDNLWTQHAVSQQDHDQALLRARTAAEEARAAEFSVQVADYELAQARALLQRGASGPSPGEPIVITSPVSGRILRVLQESARPVPGGFPLIEVGDPTDLEVEIELLSRDGARVQPGARAWLEQWGGTTPLAARVRLVEPSAFTKVSALGVEEQRVYVIADLIDPPEKRPALGDAFRVEGRVVVWEGASVLQVPAGALFQRGDLWQTFVFDHGVARLRTVVPGHRSGLATEIVSGLQENDRVIVYPGDQIADQVRVRPLVLTAR